VGWHHVAVRPFDEVVQEHGAVVMRVCRALLAPADAEDAWSETFLSALRAYPRLRPDSNVRGWLVTIAHRKALDQLRAAGRRATPAGDLPDMPTTDPPLPDDELRAAVAGLSPRQREVVVLHHLGGLPYADVAIELGVTAAAARRSAADGIAALRSRLAPPSNDGATP
jgi:RNA polymerase sigma factor (sigma-70 family)